MSNPKIIVTRSWPKAIEAKIAQHFDAVFNNDDHPMTRAELASAFVKADAVFPTVTDKIDAELLSVDNMRARLIANYGVGFNHIDLEAARARGLVVTNTPGILTDATADLTMALLLAAARRLGEGERHLRVGAWTGWRPTHMCGAHVSGKILGLIGFGRIGRAVAKRAHFGFGMKIAFYDPFFAGDPGQDPFAHDIKAVRESDIHQLASQCDFLSFHCPANAENYHLGNEKLLAAMPPHSIVINTARGDIVDEKALLGALQTGKIAAAGLDVHEFEPKIDPDLALLENIVLLPHLGSATIDTRIDMGQCVLDNALAFFAGEKPANQLC